LGIDLRFSTFSNFEIKIMSNQNKYKCTTSGSSGAVSGRVSTSRTQIQTAVFDVIALPFTFAEDILGRTLRRVLATLLIIFAIGLGLIAAAGVWYSCMSTKYYCTGGDTLTAAAALFLIPGVAIAFCTLGSYLVARRDRDPAYQVPAPTPATSPDLTCQLCGGSGMASPVYECNKCKGSGTVLE
jgi:hypothetical protein